MDLRKASMKYRGLVVFIRHDSAEIWGVQVWTQTCHWCSKNYGQTGIFVHVVFALKHFVDFFHDFDLNKA